MKKTTKITAAILSIFMLFLSSCAKKPDTKPTKTEKTDMSGSESVTVQEMQGREQEYADSIKNLKLDNMTVNDQLAVEVPEEMKTGELLIPDGYQDKYKELFPYYDKDYDEKNVFMDEMSYPIAYQYKNPDSGLLMIAGSTGFFTYDTMKYDDVYHEFSPKLEKVYNYYQAINCEDKYKLLNTDKEMSVAEAAQKAQDFADDFVEVSNYPNEFKVSRVSVYKTDSGYYFDIDYTHSLWGTRILEYYSTYNDFQHLYNENLIISNSTASIYEGDIDVFIAQFGVEKYKFDEDSGNVPDPVYATQYLSDTLAEHMGLKLQRVSLEYALFRTGNIEEKQEGKQTDREIADWAVYCSYDTVKAVPCYVFYFDDTPYKEKFAVLWLEDMTVDYVDNSR